MADVCPGGAVAVTLAGHMIVGGVASLVIVTSSAEAGHGLFVIVQRNTFGPTPNPVTVEFGEFGLVIVPDPLTKLHVPVPTVGVLPARVAVEPHTDWSGPALDVVGG